MNVPQSVQRLSILDLATVVSGRTPADALAETTLFAQEAETLGYHRFWVAEHHGMPQIASSAPAVLIGHIADATSSIRVGSGGVMLPNHAPMVIAEQFGTLEALHPGRIDLGLGRAPGSDHRTARALRRPGTGETFPEDVIELFGYFHGVPELPEATPGRGYLPEIWLLGSSLFSAQLAGALGLPFSFAHHFSPGSTDQAVAAYRSSFRPGILTEPYVSLGVFALCAPTEEEARYLARPSAISIIQRHRGHPTPLTTPETAAAQVFTEAEQHLVDTTMATYAIGSPDQVRDSLGRLAARTGADELVLATRTHDYADRVRSATLIAEAVRPVGAGT